MVRDMLTAEGEKREAYDALLGPIEDEVLEERAGDAFVRSLNLLHGPSWLGGEYLPDLSEREVEIARVVLASTTMDVFSVRACLIDGGYAYRVVDEYATRFRVTPGTSTRPLTLGELVALLDGIEREELEPDGRPFVEAWWWQQWESGDGPEECTAFAWVESEQYPGLGAYYGERARAWQLARARERDSGLGGASGGPGPRSVP